MSYDIYMLNPETREPVQFEAPLDVRGGTYAMGGTTEAWLNVTYNYSRHYGIMGDKGIRTIYGMTGLDSLAVLDAAIAQLGDDTDPDYWKATEGNAKAALVNLRQIAALCPSAIWSGD